MSGIFDYGRYINIFNTVKDIRFHFPSDQNSIDISITGGTFTGVISWQTVIVDTVSFDRVGKPDFTKSKIIGTFPAGSVAAPSATKIYLPKDMYTGPILPERDTNVPITVVTFTFTDADQNNIKQQILLIELWEPGVAPGDPTQSEDFNPVISLASNLILTGPANVLSNDSITLQAQSDIPLDFPANSQARFYYYTTASQVVQIGVGTFTNKIATITFSATQFPLGTLRTFATFNGVRDYGFQRSNDFNIAIFDGYPLIVTTNITPNPTWPVRVTTAQITATGDPLIYNIPTNLIDNVFTATVTAQLPNTGETGTYSVTSQFVDGSASVPFTVTEAYVPKTLQGLPTWTVNSGSIANRQFTFNARVPKVYNFTTKWASLSGANIAGGVSTTTFTVSTSRDFVSTTTPIEVSVLELSGITTVTNTFANVNVSIQARVDLGHTLTSTADAVTFRANYTEDVDIQRYALPGSPEFLLPNYTTSTVYMPEKLIGYNEVIVTSNDPRIYNLTIDLRGGRFKFPPDWGPYVDTDPNNQFLPPDPRARAVVDTGTYVITTATIVPQGIKLTLDRPWTINPLSKKFQRISNYFNNFAGNQAYWFNEQYIDGVSVSAFNWTVPNVNRFYGYYLNNNTSTQQIIAFHNWPVWPLKNSGNTLSSDTSLYWTRNTRFGISSYYGNAYYGLNVGTYNSAVAFNNQRPQQLGGYDDQAFSLPGLANADLTANVTTTTYNANRQTLQLGTVNYSHPGRTYNLQKTIQLRKSEIVIYNLETEVNNNQTPVAWIATWSDNTATTHPYIDGTFNLRTGDPAYPGNINTDFTNLVRPSAQRAEYTVNGQTYATSSTNSANWPWIPVYSRVGYSKPINNVFFYDYSYAPDDVYGFLQGNTLDPVNKNYLMFTSLSTQTVIGSTFTLNNLVTGASTNNEYYVAGLGISGNYRYIITDPPWYNHNPAGYDGLRNKVVQFTNPSDNTRYGVTKITNLEYTRLNQIYDDQNYTFNRCKFDRPMLKDMTFRLSGNVYSPLTSVFRITDGPDANGWYTFYPSYTTTQTSLGIRWQTDRQIYDYFQVNELNRELATYSNIVLDTNQSVITYAFSPNRFKLNYIPYNLKINATFTTNDARLFTVTAIDPQREIITVNTGTYSVFDYIGQNITFVNPTAQTFTDILLGTSTNIVNTTASVVWSRTQTLNPGRYLITATIVNSIVTGTNAYYTYPDNAVARFDVQSIVGLTPEFILSLDTSSTSTDTVIVTSILANSIDVGHFYLFDTPVSFYMNSNLIGISNWTRIGGSLSFTQRAQINIPKNTANSTLYASWPGSLEFVRTYDDQILFQPTTVYYNTSTFTPTLSTNDIASTVQGTDYVVNSGAYVVDVTYVISTNNFYPTGQMKFTYRSGEYDYVNQQFTATTSTYNLALTKTLNSIGTTQVLGTELTPQIGRSDRSVWALVRSEYQGDGQRLASVSTPRTVRFIPQSSQSIQNLQQFKITETQQLLGLENRWYGTTNYNDPGGARFRYQKYAIIKKSLILSGTITVTIEPKTTWPSMANLNSATFTLSYLQTNVVTGASQTNTSTYAGSTITVISDWSGNFDTMPSPILGTRTISGNTSTNTIVQQQGQQWLKFNHTFRKRIDHYDPASTTEAALLANQRQNRIELFGRFSGLPADVRVTVSFASPGLEVLEEFIRIGPGTGLFPR